MRRHANFAPVAASAAAYLAPRCWLRAPADVRRANRSGALGADARRETTCRPLANAPPALAIPYTWCMGGLSFFLFLVLTLTGTLLMFYYRPTTEWAYSDIKDLETVVIFGQLLRNMHRWAAHGMVITVFLHMIRVFYTGSYKPPREFNWVIGTLLFFFTILLSYTGYLLPWDQLSFWAVTVGYEIARATPFIGDEFSFVLFGGFQLGPNALLRFYVLHVVALPLAVGFLIAIHFWRIRKDGGITGPL